MPRCKYLSIATAKRNNIDLSRFPNFSASGSIAGMKKLYYGKNALLVRQGGFIYNVSTARHRYGPYNNSIYELAK